MRRGPAARFPDTAAQRGSEPGLGTRPSSRWGTPFSSLGDRHPQRGQRELRGFGPHLGPGLSQGHYFILEPSEPWAAPPAASAPLLRSDGVRFRRFCHRGRREQTAGGALQFGLSCHHSSVTGCSRDTAAPRAPHAPRKNLTCRAPALPQLRGRLPSRLLRDFKGNTWYIVCKRPVRKWSP